MTSVHLQPLAIYRGRALIRVRLRLGVEHFPT
jgi:hypothetical protein